MTVRKAIGVVGLCFVVGVSIALILCFVVFPLLAGPVPVSLDIHSVGDELVFMVTRSGGDAKDIISFVTYHRLNETVVCALVKTSNLNVTKFLNYCDKYCWKITAEDVNLLSLAKNVGMMVSDEDFQEF